MRKTEVKLVCGECGTPFKGAYKVFYRKGKKVCEACATGNVIKDLKPQLPRNYVTDPAHQQRVADAIMKQKGRLW